MVHYWLSLSNIEQGTFEETYTLEKAFLTKQEEFEITDGEIHVDLEGERTGDLFDVMLYLDGYVEVPCSRCNAPMRLPIECEQHLTIKFGDALGGDGDEVVIVPRTDPNLCLDDELYGIVVTNVPMHRTHADGECLEEVEAFLRRQADEETNSNHPFAALLDCVKRDSHSK